MGQKVNPHGFRVGVIQDWDVQWFADKKDFGRFLKEDYDVRTFIKKAYFQCGISKITIERAANKIIVVIHAGRPGMLIGKGGDGIAKIKTEIEKVLQGKYQVVINVMEVAKVDADAQLVAESVAAQLERRMGFRRTMKQSIGRAMRLGCKGVKIMVSGRLDGAEIARSEHYHEGSIPLQTLRADIDYGFAEAHTTFGVIGVKCWVYKGEVIARNPIKKGGEA
ncbi:MAG: 30S ribosomal protein S3 [Clostridia bacterium]